MFPIDSISTRQLHDADMLVAEQARSRHAVRRPRSRHWRPELRLATRAVLASLRPRRRPVDGPLQASHELFVGLDSDELRRLGTFLTVIDVPTGRSLGRQGSTAREFVTIITGRVGVTIDGIPNAVLDDGSHFGAVALLDNATNHHRASFSAMGPTRLAVATPGDFQALLGEFPTVAERIHAMTKIRRAYLAGLAEARAGETVPTLMLETVEYPAHILV